MGRRCWTAGTAASMRGVLIDIDGCSMLAVIWFGSICILFSMHSFDIDHVVEAASFGFQQTLLHSRPMRNVCSMFSTLADLLIGDLAKKSHPRVFNNPNSSPASPHSSTSSTGSSLELACSSSLTALSKA